MDAFLVSTGIVAVAEIGDKTQLLAFLLASRFRKPIPIVFGILFATVANHALAGGLGVWVSSNLSPDLLRWVLGLSFFAVAGWALIPDRMDEEPAQLANLGIFGTTLFTFFLAEIGDKTQVATAMLVANYSAFVAVIMGTTLGMMIANVPAVYLGGGAAQRLPLKLIRLIAAGTFVLLGIVTLSGAV
ncbi:MAG: TMEM165/GDT1 family protein [Gammaproteobacteria bacterium]|nr:TMEM165/GDT1 family protein [Pseudomonadales bacterium]